MPQLPTIVGRCCLPHACRHNFVGLSKDVSAINGHGNDGEITTSALTIVGLVCNSRDAINTVSTRCGKRARLNHLQNNTTHRYSDATSTTVAGVNVAA
eukprot:scaffold91620_cov20-Prasinocladus_malaysianus.AAC.1